MRFIPYLGNKSQPWVVREPMENHKQLVRLKVSSSSSGSELQGWGFSHWYGEHLKQPRLYGEAKQWGNVILCCIDHWLFHLCAPYGILSKIVKLWEIMNKKSDNKLIFLLKSFLMIIYFVRTNSITVRKWAKGHFGLIFIYEGGLEYLSNFFQPIVFVRWVKIVRKRLVQCSL